MTHSRISVWHCAFTLFLTVSTLLAAGDDVAEAVDQTMGLVAQDYTRKMTEFLSSEELEVLLQKAVKDSEYDGLKKSYFIAGYLRAWMDYRFIEAHESSLGIGNAQNLKPIPMRWEYAGWRVGCKAASLRGSAIVDEATSRIAKTVWEAKKKERDRLKSEKTSRERNGDQPPNNQ